MDLKTSVTAISICLFAAAGYAQEQSKELVNKGLERLANNQQAQVAIDKVHDKTKALEKDYLAELKLIEGLNMYNALLAKQLSDQQSQMDKLNTSISNATLIERQIVPLLVRMVDALETFVNIDVPFLKQERDDRIANLRDLLIRSDLTTSEKTRRVFEAFQIENEYGYTIESYKGDVEVDGSKFAVEFLRIGRVALMYRDMGGERVGHWDGQAKRWQPLTDSQYKRHITKGLKIAKEEIAPELITIPLVVNKETK